MKLTNRIRNIVPPQVEAALLARRLGCGWKDADLVLDTGQIPFRAAFPDLDVREVLANGSPSRELLRVQEETGASVVVMTSHGRTALARTFRGSVTDDVVRDRKSTRLNSSHIPLSRMPSSA